MSLISLEGFQFGYNHPFSGCGEGGSYCIALAGLKFSV